MDTILPGTRRHIEQRLATVEAEQHVRVLFAAESGSRAWGFASPDSDFDVRFIYAHALPWYLQLAPGRDVVEAPLDEQLVDLAGWDVRKALSLALASNPAFYEWLQSPIVYRDDGRFRAAAKGLFETHADPHALEHHYWSMARMQFRTEIANRVTPKLKRYFYVVRPLLALQWVKTRAGFPDRLPPMALADLMAGVDVPAAVVQAVTDLIDAKRATPELGSGARITILDAWIMERLDALAPAPRERASQGDTAARRAATLLFHEIIGFGAGK